MQQEQGAAVEVADGGVDVECGVLAEAADGGEVGVVRDVDDDGDGLLAAVDFGATSGDVDEIAAAIRRGKKPAAERPAEREDDAEPAGDDDTVTLYVSLGKRDGMKASELGDWLVEQAGVDRGDLLKIRTREKHSFVKVPADRAEAVIEKISQSSFEDRAVTAEPAKSSA